MSLSEFLKTLELILTPLEYEIYSALLDLWFINSYKISPGSYGNIKDPPTAARAALAVHQKFKFPENIGSILKEFASIGFDNPGTVADFLRNPENTQGIERRERLDIEAQELLNQPLPGAQYVLN